MNKLKVLTVSWCDARNTGYQDYYLNQTLSNIKNNKLFVAFPKIPVLPPKNSRFFYKPALSWRKIIYDKKQNNKINYYLINRFIHLGPDTKIFGLESLIKEVQPEIIICHGLGNYAYDIAKLKNKYHYQLIVDTHKGDYRAGYKKLIADWRKGEIKISDHFWDLTLGILSKIFYKLLKPWKRYILKKADSLVTIKKKVDNFLKAEFPKTKTIIIPLGTNPKIFFFDVKEREKLRKKYNFQT